MLLIAVAAECAEHYWNWKQFYKLVISTGVVLQMSVGLSGLMAHRLTLTISFRMISLDQVVS